MYEISRVVGATLGPGGKPVLIERYEHDLPPIITKDGVTCFRALGFRDATKQVILEAARDAAIRTASEAGDGTTTATILAESIVRAMNKYCLSNPKVSPQKIVRYCEKVLKEIIIPYLNELAIKVSLNNEKDKQMLWDVAKISANGDTDLANAVMECYDIVGDEGNVTITESSGNPHYEVEQLDGYSVGIGFEESCVKWYNKFINDAGNQRVFLDKPVFVLYYGKWTELQTAQLFLEKIGEAWGTHNFKRFNVVFVASGFSDSVLTQLAINFAHPSSINIYPLLIPQFPSRNGQFMFLQDLSAITGAKIFDQMNNPLNEGELEDLGPGITAFEATRFRSNLIGHAQGQVIVQYNDNGPIYADDDCYEDRLLLRVDEIKTMLKKPESELDKQLLQERMGKITGGIASLRVFGNSSGEIREKKDRAEDAICAVRGAIKYGCLPGGGWGLFKLIERLGGLQHPIIDSIVNPSLLEPVLRLYENAGYVKDEIDCIISKCNGGKLILDVLSGEYVEPENCGIFDSVPAVLEAIKNSISIASLLGSLGATIVFGRDNTFERDEASKSNTFLEHANTEETIEE
jgi:chaperonin GroEL